MSKRALETELSTSLTKLHRKEVGA